MKRIGAVIGCFCLVLLACAPLKADPPARKETAKESSIRALLKITGTSKVMQLMMDQIVVSFQQQNPSVPAEVWSEMKKEFRAEELIEQIIPIYDKYFTK